MNYRGSCHCGRIRFEAEGEIQNLLACNCSICQRKGSLLWFIPRQQLRLLTPATTIAVLRRGFAPVWHPSADN